MKPTISLQELPWRVGRKLGRTIYAVRGAVASDDDELLGVATGPDATAVAIAARIVRLHNAELERAEIERREQE